MLLLLFIIITITIIDIVVVIIIILSIMSLVRFLLLSYSVFFLLFAGAWLQEKAAPKALLCAVVCKLGF